MGSPEERLERSWFLSGPFEDFAKLAFDGLDLDDADRIGGARIQPAELRREAFGVRRHSAATTALWIEPGTRQDCRRFGTAPESGSNLPALLTLPALFWRGTHWQRIQAQLRALHRRE